MYTAPNVLTPALGRFCALAVPSGFSKWLILSFNVGVVPLATDSSDVISLNLSDILLLSPLASITSPARSSIVKKFLFNIGPQVPTLSPPFTKVKDRY